jgi:hypothetical protein
MALNFYSSAVLLAASSIGAEAWRLAGSEVALRVIGVTARGLFLLAPPQRVLFVSGERQRSPLTINLDRSFDRLRRLEVGAVARFSASRLIFPSIETAIFLAADAVWQCPAPAAVSRSRTEQLQTLRAITTEVMARRGDAGLAALLPALLDQPAPASLFAEQSRLPGQLVALRQAARASDYAMLADRLIGLLGQGRGLTPSGDDVVIGALLMLTRSQRVNSLAGKENLLKQVVETAYQRTTTISANLVECALNGQGDERLIVVVDGILAGSASIDECVSCVLEWGSSSGIDALAGMAIVL